jgi:tetratricopeptide (TPR) repeat protein
MSKRGGWIAAGLGFLALAGMAHGAAVKQDESLEAAKRAYEVSDYAKSILLLQSAASAEPANPEIQLWLTRAYYELQDHDAAINSAEKAVKLDPENSGYHEWLGRAYGRKAEHASWFTALGLARKTRKEFETAVKLDGKNLAARQALVEYDCAAPGIAGGGEEKAKPEIAEIAAMDASEGHYALGNCRRQKKDFATADEEFTKALEGRPRSTETIYDIGDYALRRNQPERLLAVAQAGEQVDASDPRSKFYRATGLIMKQERAEEAERLLREYLKKAPNRSSYPRASQAHAWLGRLYEEQSKPDQAMKEYETALSLDPKNKQVQEQLKRLRKN